MSEDKSVSREDSSRYIPMTGNDDGGAAMRETIRKAHRELSAATKELTTLREANKSLTEENANLSKSVLDAVKVEANLRRELEQEREKNGLKSFPKQNESFGSFGRRILGGEGNKEGEV